jgi:hypothetical protein
MNNNKKRKIEDTMNEIEQIEKNIKENQDKLVQLNREIEIEKITELYDQQNKLTCIRNNLALTIESDIYKILPTEYIKETEIQYNIIVQNLHNITLQINEMQKNCKHTVFDTYTDFGGNEDYYKCQICKKFFK